ncbi:MAG: peptide chain release factor 3 [Bdellovibrionales bacterium]|nr:peptide chain release factor 3 [Bdellovibrionales bacterium]
MENLSPKEEIERRRTFAIISHPDAGKTTITEKLIYIGGLIHEAGEVKGKAGTKAATSDWMTMEQERGISITSSVLQFDHGGKRVNLLDTPGHKDFSEDTYRTLVAADSALMLIDVAKGVEERTKKLYEVCNYRKVPIFTFINKCDREGKVPLELLDEIENTLKMKCYPVNWPLGLGGLFRGVYNRLDKKVYLYNKETGEQTIIPIDDFDDPRWKEWIHHDIFDSVMEEIQLIEMDAEEFDHEAFQKGEVSPAFWGSAKLNFGVDQFLRYFTEWAPGPGPRKTLQGEVDPIKDKFSGFIFKIQANMDRKHRDRMAFIRICSGHFTRGMKVRHCRLDREIRLSHSAQFLAQDRETVEDAFAGDIVGVSDPGLFRIGDSVAMGKKIEFEKIPQFSPELFTRLFVSDAMKRQKLQKAISELSEEGVIQLFIDPHIGAQDPIVGVVGELQFEVLKYRLQDEYNLEVRLDRAPYTVAKWPRDKDGKEVSEISGVTTVFRDKEERPVVLLGSEWDLNWLIKENEGVHFGSPFDDGMKQWM